MPFPSHVPSTGQPCPLTGLCCGDQGGRARGRLNTELVQRTCLVSQVGGGKISHPELDGVKSQNLTCLVTAVHLVRRWVCYNVLNISGSPINIGWILFTEFWVEPPFYDHGNIQKFHFMIKETDSKVQSSAQIVNYHIAFKRQS